mmetsp:Transcript_37269/g.89092  ORF Transcript_37269/g.89092 Transcript_37269/m.89092 type:complete len:730 (+) Transcript_37269:51-2240(+)
MGASHQRRQADFTSVGSQCSQQQQPAPSLNLSAVSLDTGRLEGPGEAFDSFATWEHLGSSPLVPWDSWWKLRRRRVESLFEAAASGDTARIRSLCRQPVADFDCEHGENSEPEEAIAEDADVNSDKVHPDTRGLYGRTSLHVAAHAGHASCVSALLELRASIDAQTDAGFTALHLCCQRGHLIVLQILLAAGCDLTTQADQGETPLHLAAASGQSHVVEELLLRDGDRDRDRQKSLLQIQNHFGQRPCEVAADAQTLRCFPKGVAVDSYAGRQILEFGEEEEEDGEEEAKPAEKREARPAVLLRSSRCDAVRRLLTAADADANAASPLTARPASRSLSQSFLRLQEREPSEAIGPDSFRLLSLLGKGSFGEVFRVEDRQTGQVFAMKVLRKRKILNRNLMRYALTERNLLSYIRHPFIVRLYHAFQTPSCLVLVLQYCPGGNLSMLLQREGALPEAAAQLYLSEVLLALEHLHERRVVYRDLKPENVVLDDEAHAVLTDFGLSKEGVDKFGGTKSFCGSVAYLAPEILTRSGHGRNVDLYGLGVLLFEMMEGQPPYYSRDRDTLFRNIVTAPLQAPSRCSSRCADLIKALMQRDPAKRIGKRQTSEVRSHPFFAGIDFDQVLKREVPVPPLRHWSTSFSMLRSNEKVASPFEGRFGRKVFRSWSSSAQDIRGWEFSFVDDEMYDIPSRSLSKIDVEEAGKTRKQRMRRSATLGDLRRAASTTLRTLLST